MRLIKLLFIILICILMNMDRGQVPSVPVPYLGDNVGAVARKEVLDRMRKMQRAGLIEPGHFSQNELKELMESMGIEEE